MPNTRWINVIATVEIMIAYPDGTPTDKEFHDNLVQCVKNGLWVNCTSVKVVHETTEKS